ncbi:epoxide hydrolase [Tanacetum coccineum]
MESQSETTQTVSALKLPILKTGDYDLWSMRMEQYLTHIDYALWEEPGRVEADFGHLDAKTVIRNIHILFSKIKILIAPKNQEIMDLVEPSTPLPSWFTEGNLAVYGALYEKS